MKANVILIATVAIVLSACGSKDDEKKLAPGACNQAKLDAWNKNVFARKAFEKDRTIENARAVVNTCVVAKGALGDSSCKAIIEETKEEISVSYGLIKDICADYSNAVARYEKNSGGKNRRY